MGNSTRPSNPINDMNGTLPHIKYEENYQQHYQCRSSTLMMIFNILDGTVILQLDNSYKTLNVIKAFMLSFPLILKKRRNKIFPLVLSRFSQCEIVFLLHLLKKQILVTRRSYCCVKHKMCFLIPLLELFRRRPNAYFMSTLD